MSVIQKAKQAKRKIGSVTTENVTEYLSKLGYTVLYLGTASGDNTALSLGLDDFMNMKAFTVCKGAKFVFLQIDTDKESNLALLLHELGHIVLGHMTEGNNSDNIFHEREAETFAYLVQHPLQSKTALTVLTSLAVFLAFLTVIGIYADTNARTLATSAVMADIGIEAQPKETEHVFITVSGNKYHDEHCRYIDKSAISVPLEQAKKIYAPCSFCQ